MSLSLSSTKETQHQYVNYLIMDDLQNLDDELIMLTER